MMVGWTGLASRVCWPEQIPTSEAEHLPEKSLVGLLPHHTPPVTEPTSSLMKVAVDREP